MKAILPDYCCAFGRIRPQGTWTYALDLTYEIGRHQAARRNRRQTVKDDAIDEGNGHLYWPVIARILKGGAPADRDEDLRRRRPKQL